MLAWVVCFLHQGCQLSPFSVLQLELQRDRKKIRQDSNKNSISKFSDFAMNFRDVILESQDLKILKISLKLDRA